MKLIKTLTVIVMLSTGLFVGINSTILADEHLPEVAGEVKKIKKNSGKVTIQHAPIPNLDMPGMTMVFRVEDKAALDTMKKGDKILFSVVEKEGKMYAVDIKAE